MNTTHHKDAVEEENPSKAVTPEWLESEATHYLNQGWVGLGDDLNKAADALRAEREKRVRAEKERDCAFNNEMETINKGMEWVERCRRQAQEIERLRGLLRRIERAWNPCGGECDRPFDDFNYNGDLFDALEAIEVALSTTDTDQQVRED